MFRTYRRGVNKRWHSTDQVHLPLTNCLLANHPLFSRQEVERHQDLRPAALEGLRGYGPHLPHEVFHLPRSGQLGLKAKSKG